MVVKIDQLTLETVKRLQLRELLRMCYTEPIVLLVAFTHSLTVTIMRHQLIFSACRTAFNYNITDCEQLGTDNVSDRDHLHHIETDVQPYAANLFMVRVLLKNIVPAICGIFIGAWSDHFGRKPLLLTAVAGYALTHIITCVISGLSILYNVSPWYYVAAVVPHSLFGGECVFTLAVFCYISDVTDITIRPYRMIISDAMYLIGYMSGSLLSSFIYAATNATTIFAIAAVLTSSAVILIALFLPESLHLNDDHHNDKQSKEIEIAHRNLSLIGVQQLERIKGDPVVVQIVIEKQLNNDAAAAATSRRIFTYEHLHDMMAATFKARNHYDRCIVLLVISVMFIFGFVEDGSKTVFYLYVREKFLWTVRDFTIFETVRSLTPVFGVILGCVILRKIFAMSIVGLAILSALCYILNGIIQGLATDSWHLYLSVALSIFKALGSPMCRTIISNVVPSTELGKIFSINNALQSMAPFLAAPAYAIVYKTSLVAMSGLFSLISAVLYLIALALLLVIIRIRSTHKEYYTDILK